VNKADANRTVKAMKNKGSQAMSVIASGASSVFAENKDGVVAAEAEGLGKAGSDGVGVHVSDEIQILHGIFEVPANVGGLVMNAEGCDHGLYCSGSSQSVADEGFRGIDENFFAEDLLDDCRLCLVIQTGPGSMGIDVIDFPC